MMFFCSFFLVIFLRQRINGRRHYLRKQNARKQKNHFKQITHTNTLILEKKPPAVRSGAVKVDPSIQRFAPHSG